MYIRTTIQLHPNKMPAFSSFTEFWTNCIQERPSPLKKTYRASASNTCGQLLKIWAKCKLIQCCFPKLAGNLKLQGLANFFEKGLDWEILKTAEIPTQWLLLQKYIVNVCLLKSRYIYLCFRSFQKISVRMYSAAKIFILPFLTLSHILQAQNGMPGKSWKSLLLHPDNGHGKIYLNYLW